MSASSHHQESLIGCQQHRSRYSCAHYMCRVGYVRICRARGRNQDGPFHRLFIGGVREIKRHHVATVRQHRLILAEMHGDGAVEVRCCSACVAAVTAIEELPQPPSVSTSVPMHKDKRARPGAPNSR